jgi:hypothetical protein
VGKGHGGLDGGNSKGYKEIIARMFGLKILLGGMDYQKKDFTTKSTKAHEGNTYFFPL